MNAKKRLITMAGILAVLAVFVVALTWNAASADPTVVVYKSPTCGCCSKWVEHMKASGFKVETHDRTDLNTVKAHYGVGQNVASCHTALVDGYVIEGHVPARHVRRLLAERPDVVGLSVPGMPMGSPGMEGDHSEPYDVVAFDREGHTSIFAHEPAR